eukprot:6312977-Amphidinium_carterae.1
MGGSYPASSLVNTYMLARILFTACTALPRKRLAGAQPNIVVVNGMLGSLKIVMRARTCRSGSVFEVYMLQIYALCWAWLRGRSGVMRRGERSQETWTH